jgi:hypothetical protein
MRAVAAAEAKAEAATKQAWEADRALAAERRSRASAEEVGSTPRGGSSSPPATAAANPNPAAAVRASGYRPKGAAAAGPPVEDPTPPTATPASLYRPSDAGAVDAAAIEALFAPMETSTPVAVSLPTPKVAPIETAPIVVRGPKKKGGGVSKADKLKEHNELMRKQAAGKSTPQSGKKATAKAKGASPSPTTATPQSGKKVKEKKSWFGSRKKK